MTAIVDYGVGNLFSLSSSLKYLGFEVEITSNGDKIERADRIILPGVGAFEDAKNKLEKTGLIPVLTEQAKGGKENLVISESLFSAYALECSCSLTCRMNTESIRDCHLLAERLFDLPTRCKAA